MDLASRPNDPAVEELARAIYTMFPRCMRCGEAIASYEEADIRILTQRVVHREPCSAPDDAGRASGRQRNEPAQQVRALDE